MAAERQNAEATHELRLEGIGLVLGGGLFLALLVGAFFLGRWVERQAGPQSGPGVETRGPLAEVATRAPDADAESGLTYFDQLGGGEREPEPERQVAGTPPRDEPPPVDVPAARREGDFFVQIIAVRDRSAAAELVDRLERGGYGVRLFSEREGQGMLYKVRVGGYGSRDEAAAARDALRKAGHPGAFVWPTG